MKFTVILQPEPGGAYAVVCPAIPGCVSQGNSLDETLSNIREAIVACLEVRRESGLLIVRETPEIIAQEIQNCLGDRQRRRMARLGENYVAASLAADFEPGSPEGFDGFPA